MRPLSRRAARRLEGDPDFQELLASLSRKVDILIRSRRLSIARYASAAGMSESGVQDILKARSDPKLSSIYVLGRLAGCRLYLLFEPDGRRARACS